VKIPKWAYAFDLAWRGVSGIPELRALDPEDAYRVVIAARQAAQNKKDEALYRRVADGHGIVLILGVFLFPLLYPVLIVWLTSASRLAANLLYVAVYALLILFLCYSRKRGPERLRPYILEVLRKRERGSRVGMQG
jgi:hypothetical protein